MCSEVENVVALLAKPGGEIVLEVDTGMIGGEYDAHRF
jgi:hypothetical protein